LIYNKLQHKNNLVMYKRLQTTLIGNQRFIYYSFIYVCKRL